MYSSIVAPAALVRVNNLDLMKIVRLSYPDDRYTDVIDSCAAAGVTRDDLVWFASHSEGGRDWAGQNPVIVHEPGFNGVFKGYRPSDLESACWTSLSSEAKLVYRKVDDSHGVLIFLEGHQPSRYLNVYAEVTADPAAARALVAAYRAEREERERERANAAINPSPPSDDSGLMTYWERELLDSQNQKK